MDCRRFCVANLAEISGRISLVSYQKFEKVKTDHLRFMQLLVDKDPYLNLLFEVACFKMFPLADVGVEYDRNLLQLLPCPLFTLIDPVILRKLMKMDANEAAILIKQLNLPCAGYVFFPIDVTFFDVLLKEMYVRSKLQKLLEKHDVGKLSFFEINLSLQSKLWELNVCNHLQGLFFAKSFITMPLVSGRFILHVRRYFIQSNSSYYYIGIDNDPVSYICFSVEPIHFLGDLPVSISIKFFFESQ